MRTRQTLQAIIRSLTGLLLVGIAPALAADPLGTWLTGDRKGKVEIVDCSGALCGRLIWMQEPIDPATNQPKTDKHNSDPSKQSRPLIGILILLGMTPSYTADKWDGQLYNAEDGNTYSGSFTVTSPSSAVLNGCVLGGLICKAQTWTRATASNQSQS
jgi:uncharacterized protein (DUF2147 family)